MQLGKTGVPRIEIRRMFKKIDVFSKIFDRKAEFSPNQS
jgi:hypothetical protein